LWRGQVGEILSIRPKTKNPNIAVEVFVVWAGIEPATQGFSVLCSTD
jgi:hypothetical protein